jgi:hypothetical protein
MLEILTTGAEQEAYLTSGGAWASMSMIDFTTNVSVALLHETTSI